jgi:hypothetical protein
MNFPTKPPATSRQQRVIWQKLNDYIRQDGGWTVSQPDVSPIRFECQMDSELPNQLREAGHTVRSLGTHERLVPLTETRKLNDTNTTVTTQQVGVGTVGVWQFDLPPVVAANAETRTYAGIYKAVASSMP